MKKFIISVIIFFCGWFVLSLFFDVCYTKRLHSKNIREIVIWDDILEDLLDSEMIILGSSRAADHYQPLIIDSVLQINSYNLGQYGKSADADIMRYNILKKYTKGLPSIIIWDLYFNSFNYSSQYYDEQFTPFLFNMDIWEEVNKHNRHFTLLDKFIPLLRYWKKNMLPIYDEFLPNPQRGFVYNIDKWNPSEMKELQENPMTCTIDTNIARDISLTLKDMRNNNIDVFIVFSPIYFKGKSCITNFDSIIKFISHLAYDNDCHFLDFSNDSICYDTSFFKNAMHLSPKGTDYYSYIFSRRLDSIYNNKTAITKNNVFL